MSENEVSSVGVAEEMKRLKSDSTATLDEVREFMGEMQGRSAQEALGLVAESGLVTGIVQATIGFVVVLFVLTVIPYLFTSDEPAPSTAQTESAAAAKAADQPASAADTQTTTTTDTGDSAATSDIEKAASAMGIDESKTAKPDQNPMEKKLNNLLDGVD